MLSAFHDAPRSARLTAGNSNDRAASAEPTRPVMTKRLPHGPFSFNVAVSGIVTRTGPL